MKLAPTLSACSSLNALSVLINVLLVSQIAHWPWSFEEREREGFQRENEEEKERERETREREGNDEEEGSPGSMAMVDRVAVERVGVRGKGKRKRE